MTARAPAACRSRARKAAALALLAVFSAAAVHARAASHPDCAPSTAVAAAAQTEPAFPRDEEAAENETIEAALLARATVLPDCTVTHYCICSACCGKTADNPAYGITRSGRRAAPGVSVAVDPAVIPLGSDVLVDYGDGDIQYYRADDTGSGVRGAHIDLCVESHEAAMALGVRTATVYFVSDKEVFS